MVAVNASPPASLKKQKTQRYYFFHFLLRAQKVKDNSPAGKIALG
jgi:hypothetical protein